jgi:hypothetical protein
MWASLTFTIFAINLKTTPAAKTPAEAAMSNAAIATSRECVERM